jgi:predicted nucleic acid-binding protein
VIVVDTNVLAYLLLSGERSPEAERVLVKDPVWAAPVLWRSELRSVLALYIRRHGMTVEQAQTIMDKADDIIAGREFGLPSSTVLQLVAGSACSAYDCEFVALAHELAVPLVTTDRQLLGEFPNIAVSPTEFARDDTEAEQDDS